MTVVAAAEASAVLAIPLYEYMKGIAVAAVAAAMGAVASAALEADTCSGYGSGRDGAAASVM